MTPELQTRINQLVHGGDAASLIWMVEGQIRVNTASEKRIAELEKLQVQSHELIRKDRRRISEQKERIAELEAENAALRAFVAATDEWWVSRKKLLGVGIGPEMVAIRQRLAADFNLPLPEMDGGDR